MRNSPQRWMYALASLIMLAGGLIFGNHYWQERALNTLPVGFSSFSTSVPPPACARWKEHIPHIRDPVAYRLYIEARKLWRSKLEWELTHAEASRILIDVRTAAELGDLGARALMSHFYLEGLGPLKSNSVLKPDPYKAVEIARTAAKAMQPWGLYDLGVAHEHGYGGAYYDLDLAWAYYLKAAQLGSPEAQMALARAYRESGRREDGAAMLECAYRQGHGPAAYSLALAAGVKKQYQQVLMFYQEGVKAGSIDCARDLEVMFRHGYWDSESIEESNSLRLLGVDVDPERKRRYRAIHDALQINPDLKLSRLDQVLPLPPAKLPWWSGLEDALTPESKDPPSY
jgi:TPR repeat protein